MDPLDFPDDVRVLVGDVLRRGEGQVILRVPHIVYRDIAVRVSHSHQMWLFLRELTASDAVVCPDDPLGELRVLQGPEAKQAWLQELVIRAVDVVLTIADCDQIWVLDVDIDT